MSNLNVKATAFCVYSHYIHKVFHKKKYLQLSDADKTEHSGLQFTTSYSYSYGT